MGLFNLKDSNGENEMLQDFYFPTSKKALIIFTRNPELGKCKTRLAKSVGDETALSIYKFLLKHTANVATSIKADRYVFYSEHIKKGDIWSDDLFRKKLQRGNDLGDKMANAFTELLVMGYEKICIIGSDLLDLKSDLVTDAYDKLDQNDVVLGPALDGGYYLLALKDMYYSIFINKEWGTDSVLDSTLKDLQNSKVILLQELNDIDTLEDLKSSNYFSSNKELQKILEHIS
ncbi:hypothetical protein SAMN03097699_3160 [Flavobacteriaceae bacterium MAR_2010_188]|nr:hypothetical protein SAMN03097699_3160 [Flavobacteriaceae bacterium MAR_2010_188]